MTEIKELIAALESAAEGNWELDREVWRVTDGAGAGVGYTKSVDAALTLVPDRHWWDLSVDPTGHYQMVLRRVMDDFDVDERYSADASTPALAICAAALRARQGEKA